MSPARRAVISISARWTVRPSASVRPGEEVAERIQLQDVMVQIASLEEEIDADGGAGVQAGGLHTMIDGVEPGTCRYVGAASFKPAR
jgi:hypothetical protein